MGEQLEDINVCYSLELDKFVDCETGQPETKEKIEEEKGWFDSLVDSAEEGWDKATDYLEEINEEYKVTTRAEGLLDVGTGIVEGAGAVLLLIAPEPTMLTKVGAGLLGVESVDTMQSGVRQLWTGEATDGFIAEGVEAVALGVGVSPESAKVVKDVASMAQKPSHIVTDAKDTVKDVKDALKKPDKKKDNNNEASEKDNVAIKGDCKKKKGKR